jgi:nucleotide-binding universal stress UspA family protein
MQGRPRLTLVFGEAEMELESRVLPNKLIHLEKILLATDFSPISSRAFARHYESRLYLTHIISADVYPMTAPEVTVNMLNKERHTAEKGMETILLSGQLETVPYETLIKEGSLWTAIEEVIKEHDIDLLVVGTHGMGTVQKLLIGSKAEEIFRHSTLPVLTVGPGVGTPSPTEIVFKNILFATDFGLGAERETAYAFSLAQENEARVTLLHVIRHVEDYSETGQALKKAAIKHQLQDLVPFGGEIWCDPIFRVAVGDPIEEILQAASETNADLIVMGAKARKGLAGHLPYTVAYRVVCGAHCPVLTVRS